MTVFERGDAFMLLLPFSWVCLPPFSATGSRKRPDFYCLVGADRKTATGPAWRPAGRRRIVSASEFFLRGSSRQGPLKCVRLSLSTAHFTVTEALGPRSVLAMGSPIIAADALRGGRRRSDNTISVEPRGQRGREIPRNPGQTAGLRPSEHQRVVAGSTLFPTKSPG